MTRELRPWTKDIWDGLGVMTHLLDEWSEQWVGESDSRWIPPIDITENEKEFIIEVEVPGVEPKDLQVSISDGILTLKGEKKREKGEENYYCSERVYGSFSRSLKIPDEVLVHKVDAKYKNGILHLVLPKAQPSKPKKIQVK